MSRNNKTGLDYFSHDTDMSNDIKLKFIKAKHGLIGYAVYNKLLEEIYRDNGYYLEINDRYIILFSDENKIEVDVCKDIINDCINEKLFNINLYNVYSILTSRRIQENYLKGSERRKSITLISEYLLIVPGEILKENHNVSILLINVNINKDNVNANKINANISTQSKVKETETQSKQKKKVKETEIILTEKTPSKNLQNELRIIFESHYLQQKGTAYYYDGKSAGALKQIVNKIRAVCSEDRKTDQDVITGFKYILNSLNDEWVKDNLDIPIINSKFNTIISKIKNGQNTNSNRADGKGFDLRKNSWIESTIKNALLITGENSN